MVGETRARHVFDLTRALVERDLGAALSLLGALLGAGEDPFALLGMLAREARAAWRAAEGLRRAAPRTRSRESLGRPPAAAAAMIERARMLAPGRRRPSAPALLGGRAPAQARRHAPRRAVAADRGSVRGLISGRRRRSAAALLMALGARAGPIGGGRAAAPPLLAGAAARRRDPARGHAARRLRRLSAPRLHPRRPRPLSLRVLVSPVDRGPRSDPRQKPRARGGRDARRYGSPSTWSASIRLSSRASARGCARPGSTTPRSSWPRPTRTRGRAPTRTRRSSACSPSIASLRPCARSHRRWPRPGHPPGRGGQERGARCATGRADVTGIAESRVQGPLDTELGVAQGRRPPTGGRWRSCGTTPSTAPRSAATNFLLSGDLMADASLRLERELGRARALRQRRGGRREPAAARLDRRRDGGQRARRGRAVGLGRRARRRAARASRS